MLLRKTSNDLKWVDEWMEMQISNDDGCVMTPLWFILMDI